MSLSEPVLLAGSTPCGPRHRLVCGDNRAAVAAMPELHGRADVVYLDPPYNTGGSCVDTYADRFAGDEWVEFIRPRLEDARTLLCETGVVMVAIGDDEQHRMRVLLDETFGRGNFISNVVWHGSVRGDARWVSNGAEYMLIYARSLTALKASGVRWREPRPGVPEILAAAARIWAADPEPGAATEALKRWQRTLAADHSFRSSGLRDYNKVDEHGEVFRYGPVDKPDGRGYRYPVLHPLTDQPVAVPARGWRMPPERMQQAIGDGDVVFGPDHHTPLRGKLRLATSADQVPRSVFETRRSRGGARLRELLGARARFDYPKDPEVLMRWLSMACPAGGLVVDLFAGSGTTLEAVLRMNARAGSPVSPGSPGSPVRCVAVTTNEVSAADAAALRARGARVGESSWEARGIFEAVTVPRIEAVLTGLRADGTTHGTPVAGQVETVRLAGTQTLDEPGLLAM